MASSSVALIGSTGLVGSHILSQLLEHPAPTSVTTLTRRKPSAESPKLNAIVTPDSSTWATALVSQLTSKPAGTFISALGTTRGDAGGVEAQIKIDRDLNLALATGAKETGAKTYVLISSGGANSASNLAYPRMKGELEDGVRALGFERTVILRPGLIVGGREKTRAMEQPFHHIANLMGGISAGLKDFWAQDAETIARAAVRAALEENVWEGRQTVTEADGKKVWIMGQKEIVELGKVAK